MTARDEVLVSVGVFLPRPPNFLRTARLPHEAEGPTIDVAALDPDDVKLVGEAIAQSFVRHAMERRARREESP